MDLRTLNDQERPTSARLLSLGMSRESRSSFATYTVDSIAALPGNGEYKSKIGIKLDYWWLMNTEIDEIFVA